MTPEELEEIRRMGRPVFLRVSWGKLARAVPKLVAEIDRLEAELADAKAQVFAPPWSRGSGE